MSTSRCSHSYIGYVPLFLIPMFRWCEMTSLDSTFIYEEKMNFQNDSFKFFPHFILWYMLWRLLKAFLVTSKGLFLIVTNIPRGVRVIPTDFILQPTQNNMHNILGNTSTHSRKVSGHLGRPLTFNFITP